MAARALNKADYVNLLDYARDVLAKASRSILIQRPSTGMGRGIHNAWTSIIECAEEFEAEGRDQDRLIFLILEARTNNTLSISSLIPSPQGEICLVTKLPFFVKDLVAAWASRWESMRAQHRENLLAFTARLVAAGGCSDWIFLYGLSLLREVLETARPLFPAAPRFATRPALPPPLQTPVSFGPPSLLELLPTLSRFLVLAGTRLAALCNCSADLAPLQGDEDRRLRSLADLGPLAGAAGVNGGPSGFAPTRWLFWTQRLETLSGCGDQIIASEAGACLGSMWDKEMLLCGPLTRDRVLRQMRIGRGAGGWELTRGVEVFEGQQEGSRRLE
ncbi:hypothetical protein MAPG_08590 [Magnaporthiopsis poae ATCC 64411]|uniref:Uncharacterized protein n=1 Tax=Magnaporthiopsis poae (strain ATCC 64411 / 73-15) TaxID=644358 RepID=A0A0C4E7S0_MAGP6|nr:hypothetical protein MAPG_08590 [Magnaporthiopsis poae ATCC 64411]